MSRRLAPPPLATQAGFPALQRWIVATTGLAFYADRDGDLAERVARRLAASGVEDAAAYLELVSGPGGAAELAALLGELTVGETYFFRDPGQMEALRQVVLPEILERRAAERRLAVWSVGCANGAEPYSLALLLQESGRLDGWEVSLLATDVNPRALAQAEEGRFNDWALRATPPELRGRCFTRGDGAWQIRPELRRWVRFLRHDLFSDPFPPPGAPRSFDLILCRNVLIYFAREWIATAAERLEGALAPGGWLLVGPSEAISGCFRSFAAVSTPRTVLFRRPPDGAAAPGETPGRRRAWSPPVVPRRPPRRSAPGAPRPACNPPAAATAIGGEPIPGLDRLIAEEAWSSALARCRRLQEESPLDPWPYYYEGLVLLTAGRTERAAERLDRALYLDRSAVQAHFLAGIVQRRRRQDAAAERSFRTILRLLAEREAGEPLAGLEGLTVGALRQLATDQLGELAR